MAELLNLDFDSGEREFSVNGKATVHFNPADAAFAERLFTAFSALEKKQEEYQAEVSGAKDVRTLFDFLRARDREMRDIIDGVFEEPVSDRIFGSVSSYAMAGGLPLWCNLILSVMDALDSAITKERKATNPRIEKYVKKYHK